MEYMNKGTMQSMLNLNRKRIQHNNAFRANYLEKLAQFISLQVLKGLAYL